VLHPSLVRAAALAGLVAMCGCSLVFMERIRENPEPGAPRTCTTDRELPWWDVVVGGASGGIGTGAALAGIASSEDRSGRLTVAAIMLGIGAAYGYSALRGFAWADECARSGGDTSSAD